LQQGEAWYVASHIWKKNKAELEKLFHTGQEGVANALALYSGFPSVRMDDLINKLTPRQKITQGNKRVTYRWNCCDGKKTPANLDVFPPKLAPSEPKKE